MRETSNFKLQTSKAERSTSNVQRPTLNEEGPEPCRTRDEAEAAAAIVAALTIELNDQVSEKNKKLLAVQEHDPKIEQLKARIAGHTERLEKWAKKDRKEWPEKSLLLRQAVIGFRTPPPSLVLLDETVDEKEGWKAVLVRLMGKGWADAVAKLLGLGLRRYVKVKPEVNKRQILDDAKVESGKLSAGDLEKLGVRVSQEEAFFVEPRLEDMANTWGA